MPVYAWTGRTRQGSAKKGVLEAVSEAAASAQLRSQGIVPKRVKEKAKAWVASAVSMAEVD